MRYNKVMNPAADFPAAIHTPVNTVAMANQRLGATNPTHPQVHGKIENEIAATQTKLGKGISPPQAGYFLKGAANGNSAWAELTISDVLNLQSTLTGLQTDVDSKAPLVHTHAISDTTGLQTALNGKESTIAAGTTAQYWRGDKSWQTLNAAAVPDFVTTVRGSISGTANQIIYDSSTGVISTPQDIATTSTPTFGSVTLSTPLAISSGGTGSATKNFVDLTTAQTAAGAKIFSSLLTASSNSQSLVLGDGTNVSVWHSLAGGRAHVGYDGSYLVLQGGASKGVQISINNATFGSGAAWRWDTSGHLTTVGNNTYNIGSSTSSPAVINSNSFVVPSAASGYIAYNTADQVTNYGRGRVWWNNDAYTMEVQKGGSAPDRNLRLINGGNTVSVTPGGTLIDFMNSGVSQVAITNAGILQFTDANYFIRKSGTQLWLGVGANNQDVKVSYGGSTGKFVLDQFGLGTVLSVSSAVFTFRDAANLQFGTTTGTKIGTATTEKLAFYGSTPIAKQTGVEVTAAGIHAALVSLGLFAA